MPQATQKDPALQRAQDKEAKRARGALSCAECRRLKLKCDKTVPCSSCKRRGCSAICPNGSLITGQGTRFVLADTEKLHEKIAQMSDRIRLLEDALTILHSSTGATEPHPLLDRDALKIKSIIELHAAISQGQGPERPQPEEETEDSQYIDAFGTLAIRDDGAATFYGRSAGQESILIGEVSPPEPRSSRPTPTLNSTPHTNNGTGFGIISPNLSQHWPQPLLRAEGSNLPPILTNLSHSFPLSASQKGLDLDTLVDTYLPVWPEALRLCNLYLEQAPWFFGAVTQAQLFDELLPMWYHEAPKPAIAPAVISPHQQVAHSSTPPLGGPGMGVGTMNGVSPPAMHPMPPADIGTGDASNGASGKGGSAHDLALLFVIFCFGALTDMNLPAAPDNHVAEHYYDLTKIALTLDGVLDRPPSVATVQTLSLMAIYEGLRSGENSIESTWALMGMATKLAQSIGLHRDCARWKLTPAEVQKRRALFWELFITDCWQSLATGRLATFSLPFVDCELPSDPDQTIMDDGTIQPSFPFWKARFGAECVSAVVQGTLTSRAPKYSIILELDRKVRDMDLPKYAQGPPPEGVGLGKTMSHFMPTNYRDFTLLYIHRCFFTHAIRSNPVDPIKSQYAPSFLAGYRSACDLLASVRKQFTLFPEQIARFWVLWTHAFSATIMLSSVVTHGSKSKAAPAALLEVKSACELFEKAAVHGGRAVKFLPIIQRLQNKAQKVFYETCNGVPPAIPNDIFKSSAENEINDEMSIFGGKTHTLARKSGPAARASSASRSQSSNNSPRGSQSPSSGSPQQSYTTTDPNFAGVHPSLVHELNGFDGTINAQIQNAYKADSVRFTQTLMGQPPSMETQRPNQEEQERKQREHHEQLVQQQVSYQRQQEEKERQRDLEEQQRQQAFAEDQRRNEEARLAQERAYATRQQQQQHSYSQEYSYAPPLPPSSHADPPTYPSTSAQPSYAAPTGQPSYAAPPPAHHHAAPPVERRASLAHSQSHPNLRQAVDQHYSPESYQQEPYTPHSPVAPYTYQPPEQRDSPPTSRHYGDRSATQVRPQRHTHGPQPYARSHPQRPPHPAPSRQHPSQPQQPPQHEMYSVPPQHIQQQQYPSHHSATSSPPDSTMTSPIAATPVHQYPPPTFDHHPPPPQSHPHHQPANQPHYWQNSPDPNVGYQEHPHMRHMQMQQPYQQYTPEGAMRGYAAEDPRLQETWQSYMNQTEETRLEAPVFLCGSAATLVRINGVWQEMPSPHSSSPSSWIEMHPRLTSATSDSETPITVHGLTLAASRASDDMDPLLHDRLQNSSKDDRSLLRKLGFSFFLFGLINNVLYVIILSAALDLVPPSTPKGIIAFCNIAPALVAKIGWPYVLKGRIRYVKRLVGCCALSSIGMLVVAFFDSLFARLLGICLASFSSGLGELTFLQLSTTYAPPSIAGHSIGYFASGTGAAGLVGAFLWWELRGFGVRVGVGLSSVLPLVIPLTYFFLLPSNDAFLYISLPSDDEHGISATTSTLPYTPLATNEDELGEEGRTPFELKHNVALSLNDKWHLVKPLLAKYMLPLFCVYLFEYTINQGIAPTLLYPVPSADDYPIFSKIIHSVRDYYPLWQLVYQTTVFFSRSSISLGLPPLPARLLPLPAIVQGFILLTLMFESARGFFLDDHEGLSITLVFCLISIEGTCGGLAYVNTFYRINQERPDPGTDTHDLERIKQEREFKIGSIGFADSSGILLASLVSVPTELTLCKAQFLDILAKTRLPGDLSQSSVDKEEDAEPEPSPLPPSQPRRLHYVLNEHEPPPSTQPGLKRRYTEVDQDEVQDEKAAEDDEAVYGEAHFGNFGEYMRRKRAKLQIQNTGIANDETLNKEPQIFKGIAIYVNGWTEPSLQELRELIIRYGGIFHAYLDKKALVTHIITCSLTPAKVQEFKHMKVVRPEWLVESAKQGVLLPWHEFIFRHDSRSEKAQGKKALQNNLPSTFTSQARPKPAPSTLPKNAEASSSKLPPPSNSTINPIHVTDPKNSTEVSQVPHYATHKSNPNAQRVMNDPEWRKAHTSVAPDFIEGFYKNSRLHHLSTWKAELKSLLKEAQERAERGEDGVDVEDASGKVAAEDSEDLLPGGVSMRGAEFILRSPSKSGKDKGKKKTTGDERVIMHCDFDSFFVSAGLVKRPELKGKPVVVCHSQGAQGGTSSTSEIASASYEARKFGIKNGMSLQQARKLCPTITTIPYEFELYKQFSLKFYTILMSHADDLQAVSVDEALIEVTSTVERLRAKANAEVDPFSDKPSSFDPAKELAESIRAQVRKATGCEVSIGVAHNISLARLATKRAKPAGSFHLLPQDVESFMQPLDIADLHGFGYQTKQKALDKLGVTKLGDLALKSKSVLCDALGKTTGETLYNAIRGIDDRKLESDKKRKSVSCDINYGIRFETNDQVETFIHQMANEVSRRMNEIQVLGRSITLKIMKRDPTAPVEPPKFLGHGMCEVFNKQMPLAGPNGRATCNPKVIGEHAWRMLKAFNFEPKELRGIGIQVQKLESLAGDDSAEPGQGRLPFQKKVQEIGVLQHDKGGTADHEVEFAISTKRTTPREETPDLPSLSQLDRSVFDALPADIRKELEEEYKKRSASPFSILSRSQTPAIRATPAPAVVPAPPRPRIQFPPPKPRNGPAFPFPRKDNPVNAKRITQQLAPRSRGATWSPNKKTIFMKRPSVAAWKVPEHELRKLEIDPEVFAQLPRNVQREQITAARLLKTMGTIPMKASQRIVLKPRVLDPGEVFIQPPPKAHHVQPPMLKQQGKGGERLYFHETDDVQRVIEEWVERHRNWPPNEKDVEFFGKWLVKSLEATDEGLSRALAVMKWWLILLQKHWRQFEYGYDEEDDDPAYRQSGRVAEAWWNAFRNVKGQMDSIAKKRFGGKLSIR
ncbi:deoxycytidyl transferase [Paramarasmius palmivorus]|uniref:DNA repair protein REV1 n=1 Tax=Paramarasmius palmivorus TaxID=297713 RepID=A0AAW0EGY2_9AGAR